MPLLRELTPVKHDIPTPWECGFPGRVHSTRGRGWTGVRLCGVYKPYNGKLVGTPAEVGREPRLSLMTDSRHLFPLPWETRDRTVGLGGEKNRKSVSL